MVIFLENNINIFRFLWKSKLLLQWTSVFAKLWFFVLDPMIEAKWIWFNFFQLLFTSEVFYCGKIYHPIQEVCNREIRQLVIIEKSLKDTCRLVQNLVDNEPDNILYAAVHQNMQNSRKIYRLWKFLFLLETLIFSTIWTVMTQGTPRCNKVYKPFSIS